MKIVFDKVKEGIYEIKLTGRLDECQVIVEALGNSINESKSVGDATGFLRKKLSEHIRKG
jgi:ribosome-binding factor A